MKQLLLIITVSSLAFSCRKNSMTSATVVEDCTGIYLQVDGKDWRVCNRSVMNGFNDGDKVQADFLLQSECNSNEVVCMMVHPMEGHIKVNKIRKR